MNKEDLISLHRYYIWANRMRIHFDEILKIGKSHSKNFDVESTMYMSLWYWVIYVVIEWWQELQLSDSKIDTLLDNENVHLLKKFRNGAFHYQEKYNDWRFEWFYNGTDTVMWIRALNEEFGRWFLENSKKEH